MKDAPAPLQVSRNGPVTRVELDAPAIGNALSAALVARLQEVLDGLAHDGTRLLVLTGRGKHFCTGFDLGNLDAETDDTLLARVVRIELLLASLWAAPCATVAVASGRAMGAGADLFAACEERWIVDDASFAFPGAGFGLILGSARLAAAVGTTQARAWVSSGAGIPADTALATGLATRRLDGSAVDAALLDLAARATRLDAPTQARLNAATRRGATDPAADLADLVRSAARPGLKERIVAYRTASRRT